MTIHNSTSKVVKHITLKDRQIIHHMRFTEKKKLQDIADILQKSKSSISMEIKRNRTVGQYIPETAHNQYKVRLHKKDSYKIESNPII